MPVYVVTDIFGHTPAVEQFCRDINSDDARIIDPYDGADPGFATQGQAYDAFIRSMGVKNYSRRLIRRVNPADSKKILIAFSAGAAAVWAVSNNPELEGITKAFCFYGSQIRHYPDIEPLFDMDCIFPDHEPHFDVDKLIKKLEIKKRVACRKANGLHGFMNQTSTGFNLPLYRRFTALLRDEITWPSF